MKSSPFDYIRAADLQHALELLNEHGIDAKLIAGGQSLVPMMAMRLARPALLLDIYSLDELKSLNSNADMVVMGAATRQRTIEYSEELDTNLPLIRKALRWVGHDQTRNRGTVGGSLVHADPSAELPLTAVVLGATMVVKSQRDGDRRVPAEDFFFGPMVTAVAETECLVAIEWPVWAGDRVGTAFEEVSIRHGDFAFASAACQLQLTPTGVIGRASIGVGGLGGAPIAFPVLSDRLTGQAITASLADEIGNIIAKECDSTSDIHASAEYRRHLAAVLVSRALQTAAREAKQGNTHA